MGESLGFPAQIEDHAILFFGKPLINSLGGQR
jgi:hypothetical protein